MAQDLANLIPRKIKFIFDQEQLREFDGFRQSGYPFSERSEQYWGPPPDDDTAIRELTRLGQSGSNLHTLLWPGFWWLDYYEAFRQHLVFNFPCVLQNDRLVEFNLESKVKGHGPLGSPSELV